MRKKKKAAQLAELQDEVPGFDFSCDDSFLQ
jgi:hypothetical protein